MDEHQLRIDEIGAKATESDLIGGWQRLQATCRARGSGTLCRSCFRANRTALNSSSRTSLSSWSQRKWPEQRGSLPTIRITEHGRQALRRLTPIYVERHLMRRIESACQTQPTT